MSEKRKVNTEATNMLKFLYTQFFINDRTGFYEASIEPKSLRELRNVIARTDEK